MAEKKTANTSSHLTDNFNANMSILAVLNALLAGFLWFRAGTSFNSSIGSFGGVSLWQHFLVTNITFVITSLWFNPDLDVSTNRPGKGSFPFGHILRAIKTMAKRTNKNGLLRSMTSIALPCIELPHIALNVVWQIFWQPFALLFTHRGAVHIPVFGTLLKLAYMFLAAWLLTMALSSGCGRISLPLVGTIVTDRHPGLSDWLTMVVTFFVKSPIGINILISMIVADTCHEFIDWRDSVRGGTSFIPPANIAPIGVIRRIYRAIMRNANVNR